MKNKKAILMPETLKIIIAVMCLLLLAYLSVSMYGVFSHNTEIEQAGAGLEEIAAKINGDWEADEIKNYLIIGPKGWILSLFIQGEEMPVSCKNKNCLCFCPEKRNAENCEEEGVCEGFDEEIEIIHARSTTSENMIGLLVVPQDIFLEKKDNKIIISEDKSILDDFNVLLEYLNYKDEKIILNNEIKTMKEWIISFDDMGNDDFEKIKSIWEDRTNMFFVNRYYPLAGIYIKYPSKKEIYVNKDSFGFDFQKKIKSEFREFFNNKNGEIELKVRFLNHEK